MNKECARILVLASLAAAAATVGACGSDSRNDADVSGAACTGADLAPGNVGGTITVHNFDNRCTVSLNYTATNVSSSYQACVAIGNQTAIVIGPASPMFELGPTPLVRISSVEVIDGSDMIFNTGDGGFGSTSTHVVGISPAPPSSPACALVCCPFADGTGCDSSQGGYTAFLSSCP